MLEERERERERERENNKEKKGKERKSKEKKGKEKRRKEKGQSWGMESKPPSTLLGRKDSMSIIPEFCKRFSTLSMERKV